MRRSSHRAGARGIGHAAIFILALVPFSMGEARAKIDVRAAAEAAAFDASVHELIIYDGMLIAAGIFSFAGPTRVNGIARWGGSAWQPLESQIEGGVGVWSSVPGYVPWVSALGIWDGKLAVGGAFATAGGVEARSIALWDGQNWSALGGGIVGRVTSVHDWFGNLAVGGAFFGAGGLSLPAIAQWNGENWFPFGPGFNNGVETLHVYDGFLHAGGNFSRLGDGYDMEGIARWEGNAWFRLAGGLTDGNPTIVFAMVEHEDQLIVAGSFREASGIPVRHVASWDGGRWSPMGAGFTGRSPLGEVAARLTVYRDRVIAGGRFDFSGQIQTTNLAWWDGDDWRGFGQGADNAVWALLAHEGSLLLGGAFEEAFGEPFQHLAVWEGAIPGDNGLSLHPDPLEDPVAETTVQRLTLRVMGAQPSSNSVRLRYELPRDSGVQLSVHDARGRRLVELRAAPSAAGVHELHWNGRDAVGRRLPPGVYFARLRADGRLRSAKLILAP